VTAIEVRQSDQFQNWLRRLRDDKARARIANRIRRMELGNPGDTRQLGGGLIEMKIDYGPGYRVYFAYQGDSVVILLCGGDKRTRRRDIEKARAIAQGLKQ
jgi:putative addiction module killer protein